MSGQPRRTTGKRYCIVVGSEFGELLTCAFGDLSVQTGGGQTVLLTPAIDQSQLQGILDRLFSLVIEVITVRRLGCSDNGEELERASGAAPKT
jgi:hypothetical protein